MTTAYHARQSDPTANPQFRRRWTEPPQKRQPQQPTADTVTVAHDTIIAWRDAWRADRAAERAKR